MLRIRSILRWDPNSNTVNVTAITSPTPKHPAEPQTIKLLQYHLVAYFEIIQYHAPMSTNGMDFLNR